MVQAHPRARHQTWRGSDIDRGFGRSTLIAALPAVVGGDANHCRQSSHQGLGVVLHQRTCRLRVRGKNKTTQGRVKDQSQQPVLCAVALLLERAEAKRQGQLERMRNEQDNEVARAHRMWSQEEGCTAVASEGGTSSRATEPQRNSIPRVELFLITLRRRPWGRSRRLTTAASPRSVSVHCSHTAPDSTQRHWTHRSSTAAAGAPANTPRLPALLLAVSTH